MTRQKTRPRSIRTADRRTEEKRHQGFFNFLRMDYQKYQEILIRIGQIILPKISICMTPLTAAI
ncbi:hypothetical protein DPMN_033829 [Dreissena polymorpha]|uniref:Uncharacterized protein n=1 Tax=Dreissena polymorpha TaxID=45954 RepID=A0A9D4M921_DREPO|nr:hypothetical protein DPMN_033829 [Dreissena polymorpha]